MAVELDFRQVSMEHPDAAGMVAAMVAEIDELYADIGLDLNAPNMPKAGVTEFSPPGGTFVVGYRDGVAVCGGGVKRLPDGACEIKRMYVVPAARRQGLARALLSALEDAARALGYSVVRLDSGPRQGHAVDLYTSEGYVPIGNFNDNPVATYFGEKTL
ncbi:GNAT family N-acetyltransferase [Mycobacterium sp. 236(2023)]|uniref:GNAT family N-acetyltransferase n=1 Tax=Mycobacterium sp. 236(2023) TaxID=3038163 RepID=UPI0024151B21|nr:GNAT family N-acetyltransferase [Mycobacterium sp. 236(2023)]MDG4668942.1 GNAT family N-acetyltransferase [Mycobacterium sp. 236(2023)]